MYVEVKKQKQSIFVIINKENYHLFYLRNVKLHHIYKIDDIKLLLKQLLEQKIMPLITSFESSTT